MSVPLWISALVALLFHCARSTAAEEYKSKVLIVSMDGFRWDYWGDASETPNFHSFAKEGSYAEFMNGSFPTKTFPSHYTMITGLYSESHGIVENRIYDPEFNETFRKWTVEPRWWNEGEPVWVTAKKQGLRTGAYFWPGSEAKIRGVRPDYYVRYDEFVNSQDRVDTVIDWLLNKDVQLAALYFSEPDKVGHSFGPSSPEVKAKVKDMDNVLGYLVKKLKDGGLDKEVNVIITSDHGMADTDVVNMVVDISDHVDMSKIKQVPSYGPLMHILPEEGELDTIIGSLSGVDHITVYKKENMPQYLHYKNNRRIMPIIILPDEGWLVTTNKTVIAETRRKGQHGYDQRLMSMKAIFLANGPNFKRNFRFKSLNNVDLYPLICKLLSVTPSPNNGSLEHVEAMLVITVVGNSYSVITPSLVLCLLTTLMTIAAMKTWPCCSV